MVDLELSFYVKFNSKDLFFMSEFLYELADSALFVYKTFPSVRGRIELSQATISL